MKETTVVIGEDLLVAGGRSKKHMDELLEKIPISFMERANYSFFFYIYTTLYTLHSGPWDYGLVQKMKNQFGNRDDLAWINMRILKDLDTTPCAKNCNRFCRCHTK